MRLRAPVQRWTRDLGLRLRAVAQPAREFSLRALVAVLVLIVAVGCGAESRPPATSNESPTAPVNQVVPTAVAVESQTPGSEPTPLEGGFPSLINGMPVQTVAQAHDLLVAGELDGRAVAVAGYFSQSFLSCPAPMRNTGPLENWCRLVAFTDTEESAQVCSRSGSGMSCSVPPPEVPNLDPFLMVETSGGDSTWGADAPRPLVVIGHSRDPRAWQCWPDTQQECTRQFVVDRVAWAGGDEIAVSPPETGDNDTGRILSPAMSLQQVGEAAGVGDGLLTAAVFRAKDISAVDPRWNSGWGRARVDRQIDDPRHCWGSVNRVRNRFACGRFNRPIARHQGPGCWR